MDAENKKGIGLAALVAIIVSGAIGGGVFNLSNDLATNASPGGVVNFQVYQIMHVLVLVIWLVSFQVGVIGYLHGQVTLPLLF